MLSKEASLIIVELLNLCEQREVMLVTDIASSKGHGGGKLFIDVCPCLTKSRCEKGGHWLLNLNRAMTIVEMARLQGIPDGRLKIPGAVTEKRYGGMLGNSFTVSVVGRIALRLLCLLYTSPSPRD